MHVVECAAAETRDQAPSRTTAMFAWDPYAAFFLGRRGGARAGGDDDRYMWSLERRVINIIYQDH